MNKRGDTPVWTIIVFGIIAIVVLVLAIIMLSGSATAGGNKITDLFGIIEAPKIVQAEQGDSVKGGTCIKSLDCASATLACVDNVCVKAASTQSLTVDGVGNCAKNYEAFSRHGAAAGQDWCVATLPGFTYQVEYNTGEIIYDTKKPKTAIDKIVMLDISTEMDNVIIPTPALGQGQGPKGDSGLLYWLPTRSIHTFEGGPFVCGWYLDSGCSNNGGAVLVRLYQLEKAQEDQQQTDSGIISPGAGEGAQQGAG